MNAEAIILRSEGPTSHDLRFEELGNLMGVPCRRLRARSLDAELDSVPNHSLCIVADAHTIGRCCQDQPSGGDFLRRLQQKARFLFVYGFWPDNAGSSAATSLTGGQIKGIQRFEGPAVEYKVTSSNREITKEFSGLSFGPIQNQIDFGFVCSSGRSSVQPLVSIAGLPSWALFDSGACTTFLVACSDVVDINEVTNGSLNVARYFSRLLPAAMFLKWVFGAQCWHSCHRFANLIVDDPLLKPSYGYLNYYDLVSKMEQNDFATTIAFIPWNYRRTQSSIARLFRDRADRLSLCIHGCNHTESEFSSTDLGILNQKARLASRRMRAHRAYTGLLHADVMVFPQGRFSLQALKALKANNYVAAVNSSATPSGPAARNDLRVADFLELAITRYEGFPLFLRRYPRELEGFAFDLFFGKPLLAVEHHAYFKDGGRRLVEFVAELNSLGKLHWTGLTEIMTRSYLEQEIAHDTTRCKIYANLQVIENRHPSYRTFVISKPKSDEVPIEGIFVNGHSTSFEISNKLVQFALIIPAKQSVTVNVVYKNQLPCARAERGIVNAGRVWTRRMLSEFRDNLLL